MLDSHVDHKTHEHITGSNVKLRKAPHLIHPKPLSQYFDKKIARNGNSITGKRFKDSSLAKHRHVAIRLLV